uniref:low temperature requirement protein A n=1 Tax=Halomonas sp. TaxID=1486246 RepID=UPI0026214308|nr:low temperature requirement protein A [Halomonas sp.]
MPLRLNLIRPTHPRDPHEPHRAATPLELLFDLVSVIAIASAVAGLHHSIADDHVMQGVVTFSLVFFPIWWAWMNFTWYASAYDNDDVLFRLMTMVIMSGALIMAAGITRFFHELDLSLIVIGFVVMRVGIVVLWLRAALHDRQRRQTALTYAVGISLVQCYWVWLGLNAPQGLGLYVSLFVLGAAMELCVPVIAERHLATTWHRHHLIERYGLLNIIVLGETLLAGSLALAEVIGDGTHWGLAYTAFCSLVIVFAMWWL